MNQLYLKVPIDLNSTAYKIKKIIVESNGCSKIFSQKGTKNRKVFIWVEDQQLSKSETASLIYRADIIADSNTHRTILLTFGITGCGYSI